MRKIKSEAVLIAIMIAALLATMCRAGDNQDMSGQYSIVKVESDGYPANHSDFIHFLKWKKGSDVVIKVEGTNSLTVTYHTKFGETNMNVLSAAHGGYSIRRQDGALILSSQTQVKGYMLPGSVTVEKVFRFHLNPEHILVVESSHVEKGRAFGVFPWHDEPDRQVLHLKQTAGTGKGPEQTPPGDVLEAAPEE